MELELARSLNGILGPEIVVSSADPEADDGFNARFSATYRRYRYLMALSPAWDPLTRHQVWHVGRSLDIGGDAGRGRRGGRASTTSAPSADRWRARATSALSMRHGGNRPTTC